MKSSYIYREDEPDPLNDNELIDITVEEIVRQLKHSRKLVAVAEWDRKIFEEDRLRQIAETEKEWIVLRERKRLAELGIRYSQHNLNHIAHWLERIWVRYGRPRTEALPFRCVAIFQINAALQRKINTKRRKMDTIRHGHCVNVKKEIFRDEWRHRLEHVLDEKKNLNINIFRSNDISTGDFYLRTIVRQTREVIMQVGNHMTYFDALRDSSNKFIRIKDYLADEHIHFGRILCDLKKSIVEQEQQLRYLAGVFNESASGAYRAEKAYNETDSDLLKAAVEEKAMLQDLNAVLEEHRTSCNNRLTELVAMNVEIKECVHNRPQPIRYPFHQSDKFALIQVPENTELVRAYEMLEDLTQSSTTGEVYRNVKQQVERSICLHSANSRLESLLQSVLLPEEKLFADEMELNCMSSTVRREALENLLHKVHAEFDRKITKARRVINQQRDTADEFDFFLEVLGNINARLLKTFPYAKDKNDVQDETGLAGLLILTSLNMTEVACVELRLVLSQSWDQLKDNAHHRDFLEYRRSKLQAANNRTKFEQPDQERTKEDHNMSSASLSTNTRYVTNAQIKEANWQIQERSRLAELERLKLANLKDEEERQMLEKRKQREEAAVPAAHKSDGKKLKNRKQAKAPTIKGRK